MNIDAAIDFIIKKPIQKQEFNEVFNKIIMQMHLQLNQVSMSMNEIIYPQGTDNNNIVRQPVVTRATSAFIKDFATHYAPLSYNRYSESGNLDMQSPSGGGPHNSSFFGRTQNGNIKRPSQLNPLSSNS